MKKYNVLVTNLCATFLCFAVLPSAWADPVAVVVQETTGEHNPPGTRSYCVLVNLSSPDDNLLSIAFTQISTDDPAGFFQVPPGMFGGDHAPLAAAIPIFPVLEADSYVTIGIKINDAGDTTSGDGDWIPVGSCAFNCDIQADGPGGGDCVKDEDCDDGVKCTFDVCDGGTWCSMPSASVSASRVGTPSASKKSTTT